MLFKHHQFVEGITVLIGMGYVFLAFFPQIRTGVVLAYFLPQLATIWFIEKYKDEVELETWQKIGFLIVNVVWVWWGLVWIGIITTYF